MQVMERVALPLILVWRLVSGILNFTVRFIAMLVGPILIVVGAVLTLTCLGAIIGVPLLRVGWQLVRQGLS